MKLGTYAWFLAIVDEIVRAMRNGILELEEAKMRVRVVETGKIEALCKLKGSRENLENEWTPSITPWSQNRAKGSSC